MYFSERVLQSRAEALVALEQGGRAEAAGIGDVRIPVAQVERPLLVEAEGHTHVPVGVVVLTIAEVAPVDSARNATCLVVLVAVQGAEGGRKDARASGLGGRGIDPGAAAGG